MSGHVREGSWRDGPSRLMVLTRFTTNHSSSFDHVVTGHGSVAPSISQHLLRRPRPSVPTVWTSRGPCVDRHITSEGRTFTMDVGLQCNALPRPAQARQARQAGWQVGRLPGPAVRYDAPCQRPERTLCSPVRGEVEGSAGLSQTFASDSRVYNCEAQGGTKIPSLDISSQGMTCPSDLAKG
jgi:hypothetical protein